MVRDVWKCPKQELKSLCKFLKSTEDVELLQKQKNI